MPSAAQDTDEESEQDVTPQAKPTAQKSAPNEDNEASDAQPAEQSDSYQTPANAVMPAQRDRTALTRSFAAQGYGAPSKDYQGPDLAPPPDESQPSAQDLHQKSYQTAKANWQRDVPNSVQDDLADNRQSIEADLGGRSFTPRSEPDDRYLRAADQETDQEARQAMQDARAQRIEEMRQQKAQQGQVNDQNEQQMQQNGQESWRDSSGVLQPKMDANGHPVYKRVDWAPSQDPKTGEPAEMMIDQSGQRQFRVPDIKWDASGNSDNAFINNRGTLSDSGKPLEEFAQSKNPVMRMKALQAIVKRNAARNKNDYKAQADITASAIKPYNDAASELKELVAQRKAVGTTAEDADPVRDKALKDGRDARIAELTKATEPGGQLEHAAKSATQKLQLLKSKHDLQAALDSQKASEEYVRQNPNNPRAKEVLSQLQDRVAQLQQLSDAANLKDGMLDVLGKSKGYTQAGVGQPVSEGVGQPLSEPNEFQKTEPAQLAAQGVKNIGAFTPQELAAKYGDGTGPVQPASLVKIAQRVNDLNTTLSEASKPSALPAGLGTDQASTNVDPKITASMTEERDYLKNLGAQRYAQLTPDARQKVDDATRDPTFWEKVGGAGQSLVRGAANAVTDVGEGVARNALRLVPMADPLHLPGTTDAAQEAVHQGAEFERGVLNDAYNGNKNPQIAKKLQDSTLTGVAPEAIGGLLPFVIGGAGAGKVAQASGMAPDAVEALTRVLQTAAGGAQGGTSLRNEAIQKLKPMLDDGKMSNDEYQKAIGIAELGGSVTGAGAMELGPISKFANRLGGTKTGKTLIETLLSKAGKGGVPGVVKWLQGEGQGMLQSALREGLQMSGITFGQTLLNDLTAQQSFDPSRKLDVGKAANEAGKMGIIGALVGALTHLGVKKGPPDAQQTRPNNPPPGTPPPGTPAEPIPAEHLAKPPENPPPPPPGAPPAAPATTDVGQPGNPAQPPGTTKLELPHSEAAPVAEAPKPEPKAVADKIRTAPQSDEVKAEIARANRQRPIDIEHREVAVDKMTNAEVAALPEKEQPGISTETSTKQSGEKSNEQTTASNTETVRDQAAQGGREGEAGVRGAPPAISGEPANGAQPVGKDSGAGREGGGAQEPGAQRGERNGVNEPGAAAEPAPRDTPVGAEHPLAPPEPRPGVQEEPRRDTGQQGADSERAPQSGRGPGGGELGEPENALPIEGSKPVDVQPTPENGKGVGVENAVDQGAAGKGEAKAQNPEAVPEKPVESEGNGPTKDEGDAAAGFEAQPKPDTSIKDATQKAADFLRKGKGKGLRMDITGGIWDASIEMAAQTIEKGGTVAQAIANAIKRMRAMKPDATAEHEKAIEDHIRNAVGEPRPTEAAKAAPVEKKKEAPVAAKPEKAPAKTQASNYGIAARVTAARAAKGDIEPVESGEGTSGPEQVERGRELIKEGRSAQASLDAFRKDKKLSGDDMALVRAHGEDLAQAAKDAFDKYGMKSAEYKAAAKADSDWPAAIKPMQTEWHKIGEAQQGETEIDTGSFHGMRRAFTEATGRDFTPEQADKAEKISGQVKKAQDSADAARDKLLKAIKEQVPEEAAPKPDIGRLTKYFDDRAAEARQRLKDRSAGKIASANPLIADLGDRAIIGASYIVHGANKVADFARKWRDEFGDTTDRDMMAIWKASNEEHQKGVEGIVGAGVAAKTRAAKPTNPVWDAAKRYIDAGETSFDDVRHKVATDLGLPVAEVSRRLAEPKALRTVTNEMYQKMAARRNIISNAKNWLENQQAPGWLRAIKALPRAAFAAATFGHGSVGMVTHSAVNAFNPGAWSTYFPNFFKQFRMMGFHDKGAYHEAAIQNLIRDPNFTTARRAGLANDPSRITGDYEKAWTGPFFARVGLAGVRGFDTLKLFRQDRFNSIWENTPKSLQTPEMAKMVAIGINHATGIVGGQIHPGASTLFFAPKLEVSRWAFMIGDQAKASKTILNWKNETPEARQNALATVKQFATITGTYAGLLAINQGLLSAAGSDQKVNFTNPKQGDFLAFKAAGYRLGIVSPMIGMVRLFAELLHDSVGDRSTFEKLDSRADEIEKDTDTYIRQKFSPIATDVADVVSQADYAKRPLPFSSDKVPPYLAKQGVGKYTYPEWLTERAAPIPVSEAAREVWRKQGMNETDIHHWLNALTVASVMGSTGARLNGDTEPAKPPSYEPPTRKLFGTPH